MKTTKTPLAVLTAQINPTADGWQQLLPSGEFRSRDGKEQNFELVDQSLQQANEALKAAHQIQTELISEDEGTGKLPVNIILVHAQNHVMNAVLLMDIVKELIELHKK